MEIYLSVESEVLETVIKKVIRIATEHPEKYISPVLLRTLYRGYCQWRLGRRKNLSLAVENRIVSLERCLIHYMIERCYWIRYGDCETVTDLLKELYDVDGHLGKILDFQQLSLTPRRKKSELENILSTTWTDPVLWMEEVQPIDYFMEHAYKMKALFNGKRLVEHYFVQCVKHHREMNDLLLLPPCARTFTFPEVLIKLLQYGLFANSTSDAEDIGKLLTGIMGVILNCSMDCDVPEYAAHIIHAGNVLLRAVPSVEMSTLLKEQKLKNKKRLTASLVKQLSCPRLLPLFQLRCTGPQELQHLCRRTVRRTLYANWELPHGIFLLSLPGPVKEYINLQRD